MAKRGTDNYSQGYRDAKKLAHEVGAEPEHHAYGGRMGRMAIRGPRIRPLGNMVPGAPAAGLPGLGAAPGPMPASPQPMLKRGGKAKKYAKGGDVRAEVRKAVHKHEKHDHKGEPLTRIKHGGKVVKKAMGGGVSGVRKGASTPDGKPVIRKDMPKASEPMATPKSRGKNGVKGG